MGTFYPGLIAHHSLPFLVIVQQHGHAVNSMSLHCMSEEYLHQVLAH